MIGLLYKEFNITKWNILSFTIVCTVLMVLMVILLNTSQDDSMFATTDDIERIGSMVILIPETVFFFGIAATADGIFGADERKKWAYYITSTPGSVREQIGAKYIFFLIMIFAGKAYLQLVESILIDTGLLSVSLSPIHIYFLAFIILMASVIYPTIVRFGNSKSAVVRILALLAAIFVWLVWKLYFQKEPIDTDKLWESFFSFVRGESNMMKIASGLNIFTIAVIPVYYLSYRISCALYLKKRL